MVNIKINGKNVMAEENMTILEAAKQAGVHVPTLCFLKDLNEIGSCKVCVVEVEGEETCVTACRTQVREGMVVYTNSPKARKARTANTKLILANHNFECATCVRSSNCALQALARDLNITSVDFRGKVEKCEWDNNFPLIRDAEKCIKCMRCVQVCSKVQDLHVWDMQYTGAGVTIGVTGNKNICDSNCSLCGQCIKNCPVGALKERDDIEKVMDAVGNKDLVTVVQIAPAVRTAWGEGFGLEKEYATAKRLVAALRNVGFDYIFDTTFTADLTIMEEGSEFLVRLPEIKESKLPMFTSCCPGWVRFVKSEYPEFYSRLSSAKSPQQMFGAITKSYFAEKMGIDPEKIFCISIMPCVAKKDERTWDGGKDVDAVLTTREVERLLKMHFVDVNALEEDEFDSPLGAATGAGVIFGTTGGVMEAALRSAYYLVTGSNPDADAFKDVRGLDGWKEAVFSIEGTEVKVAVVSGLGNTRKLLEAIKAGTVTYDFVEIMACPGGCVNGGGQPIQLDGEDVETRAQVLYGLDKRNNLRFSHENPEVLTCYEEYLGKPLSHKAHELLHVH